MYKVIYKFADLQDRQHVYNVGDIYPREGSKPSQERIECLANGKNKIGRPLIKEILEEPMKYENTKVGQLDEKPIEVEEEKPKPRKRRKKADSE